MTDALQLIDFDNLKLRGVTDRMIELCNDTLFAEGEEIQPWGHYEPSPALLGGDVIHVRAGKKHICPLYLGKENAEWDKAWVHACIAKWLRVQSHEHHPELAEINKLVMSAYQVLGCDKRFDEAHVIIHDSKGVMVYGEPTWRESNDDTGVEYTVENLLFALEHHLPTVVHPLVEKQISRYMEHWESIYGGEPKLTAFVKKFPAGSHLFIVIGNEKNAVTIQFNTCNEIDRMTLKPTDYIRSVFKDFK